MRLPGCALSVASVYKTPLYDLHIDQQGSFIFLSIDKAPRNEMWVIIVLHFVAVYRELEATGHFEFMSMTVDEEEHSIEMQLPYIAKVMEE